MIFCGEQHIEIDGGLQDIVLDLVNIIMDVRAVFAEDFGDENADKIIEIIGRLAFADEADREYNTTLLNEIADIVTNSRNGACR